MYRDEFTFLSLKVFFLMKDFCPPVLFIHYKSLRIVKGIKRLKSRLINFDCFDYQLINEKYYYLSQVIVLAIANVSINTYTFCVL